MIVFVDIDGTLLDRREAMYRWAGLVRERYDLADGTVEHVLRIDNDGSLARSELHRVIESMLSNKAAREDFANWAEESYLGCFAADARTHRGLGTLRDAGLLIAAVSNGNPARQRRKLEHTGIARYFDTVCTAQEAGAGKPHEKIFALAAGRLGSPVAGWVVGDDPLLDIQAGARLGLRTIWVRGNGPWPELIPEPDYEAEDFGTAADLIVGSGGV